MDFELDKGAMACRKRMARRPMSLKQPSPFAERELIDKQDARQIGFIQENSTDSFHKFSSTH